MPVSYRGVTLDQSTVDKLKLAEAWIGFPLAFAQGSYSSGVAASAGTHSGGGAVDVETAQFNHADTVTIVHWLRAVGFAAWYRPPNWDGAGGGEHCHAIEIGNPNLSSAAASQITQWNDGDDGLADWASDTVSVDVEAGRPGLVTDYPGQPTPPTPPPPAPRVRPLIYRYLGGN